jgi:hypothetical protein
LNVTLGTLDAVPATGIVDTILPNLQRLASKQGRMGRVEIANFPRVFSATAQQGFHARVFDRRTHWGRYEFYWRMTIDLS